MKSIQRHYNQVAKFNEIGESFSGNLAEAADLYLSLVFEELSECVSAFEEKNPTEMLDGACDILVTAFGLVQALEKAGFDMDEAMERVTANNLDKFPSSVSEVPKGMTATLNGKYNVFVLKDVAGKIRKPPNFKSVDLGGTVREDFFQNTQGE